MYAYTIHTTDDSQLFDINCTDVLRRGLSTVQTALAFVMSGAFSSAKTLYKK